MSGVGEIINTDVLDKLSEWNGRGNDFVGNYGKVVGRPLRSLIGYVSTVFSPLAYLQSVADARTDDRTNGIVIVEDSPNNPAEIAALTVGLAARVNSTVAAQSMLNVVLPEVLPGAELDVWSNDYDNRDLAVKGGLSPAERVNGAVRLQNLRTFFRPGDLPEDSNVFGSYRNLSIVQNVLFELKSLFLSERWQGVSIVADVNKVTDPVDRLKARDIDAVIDDIAQLVETFGRRAWIYDAEFTIERLQVDVRPGGIGFNSIIPLLISGEGMIYDNLLQFDAALSVLTN